MMEYRNELKYICSAMQMEIIRSRLVPLMQKDEHLNEKEVYNIRSIYFDDFNDSFLRENEAGIGDRVKIRVRIYNHSYRNIHLEFKYKNNQMTRKDSSPISETLCRRLMKGN